MSKNPPKPNTSPDHVKETAEAFTCPSHIEARERLVAKFHDALAGWPRDDAASVLLPFTADDARFLEALLATPTQEPQPRGWPTREEVDLLRAMVADLRKTAADAEDKADDWGACFSVEDRQKMRDEADALDRLLALFPPCETAGGEAMSFQSRVQPWMMACFGPEISGDKLERGDRHLEEVLELLQSGDYPPERVTAIRDYVFARPKGEPKQEVGGVMVTLAAYCLAHGIDMHEAGEVELARIWTKVEQIRAKQAAKPVGSALPLATTPSPASTSSGEDAPGAPEGWREIAHPHRPPSAVTERDYLHRQIERVGEEGAVVGTLCTSALAADSRGSFAGYLWAIAEWAQAQIVKKSEAALTSSSAKPVEGEGCWYDRFLQQARDAAKLEALPQSNRRLREGLQVIASASERSETMFGGKMSEVTRVFENITRIARAALKDNGHG